MVKVHNHGGAPLGIYIFFFFPLIPLHNDRSLQQRRRVGSEDGPAGSRQSSKRAVSKESFDSAA